MCSIKMCLLESHYKMFYIKVLETFWNTALNIYIYIYIYIYVCVCACVCVCVALSLYIYLCVCVFVCVCVCVFVCVDMCMRVLHITKASTQVLVMIFVHFKWPLPHLKLFTVYIRANHDSNNRDDESNIHDWEREKNLKLFPSRETFIRWPVRLDFETESNIAWPKVKRSEYDTNVSCEVDGNRRRSRWDGYYEWRGQAPVYTGYDKSLTRTG